jgi:hypothetical protein
MDVNGPPIADVRSAFESVEFDYIEMYETLAERQVEFLRLEDLEAQYFARPNPPKGLRFTRALCGARARSRREGPSSGAIPWIRKPA